MKVLDNLRFRSKLLLILILPIIGIFYFSFSSITERFKIYTEMTHLEELTDLSAKVSALVHETQKERGRTAGFLGSAGKDFVRELDAQRELTDAQISEYEKFIANFDTDMFGKNLSEAVSGIYEDLSHLQETRSAVDSLNIKSEEAINYYTQMNAKLLETISIGAKISTEGKISSRLFAYNNFLLSKERAGIERAVLSNTFAADRFGPGMLETLISLIAEQEAFLDNFINTAADEDLEIYNEYILHSSFEEVEKMRTVALEHADTGNFGIAPSYWFDTITTKINQLKLIDDALAANLDATALQMRSNARRTLIMLSIFTLAVIVVTFIISSVFIKSMIKQLGGEPREIEDITSLISQGDLSFNYDQKRILSGVYKNTIQMVEKLREVISHALITTDQVASSSADIARGNQDLSGRTEQQATALEETSAAMEEMTSSVRSNADNTEKAVELAELALERSSRGAESVDKLIESMNDISESSNQITEILDVINSIAFQTNLLALNASIEAARAGIHGKGFAVVAVEVRKLAKRSNKAAAEIGDIIKHSNSKTKEGVKISENTAGVLNEINNSFRKVNGLVTEISEASKQQLASIEQINSALQSLDDNTQKNASLVEESAAATEEMSAQANDLNDKMNFFRIEEGI